MRNDPLGPAENYRGRCLSSDSVSLQRRDEYWHRLSPATPRRGPCRLDESRSYDEVSGCRRPSTGLSLAPSVPLLPVFPVEPFGRRKRTFLSLDPPEGPHPSTRSGVGREDSFRSSTITPDSDSRTSSSTEGSMNTGRASGRHQTAGGGGVGPKENELKRQSGCWTDGAQKRGNKEGG